MSPSPHTGAPGPGAAECPVCGSSPMSQRAALHGFPLLSCAACGHHCLWTVGADLSAFYDTHYAGFRKDPVFDTRVREVMRTTLAPLLPARARVLDVGCGNGEFLQAARESGHDVFGIDFSKAAADACEERGIAAVAADFLTYDFGARAPFDLVTLWDVCEHLERPLDFARRAREILAPGGWLVLKVPCFTPRAMWMASHLPRVAGPLLGSPSHIQYFRPEGLTEMLRRAGFRLIQVEKVPGMRSRRATTNPLKLAKVRLVLGLGRFAGNANTLVRAQVGEG